MSNGLKKVRLMCMLRILQERTDEEHGIRRVTIESMLKEDGYEVTRKIFYEDIKTLRDNGHDILHVQENGRHVYKLVSRKFEIAELKLLVDTVQSSKFIPENKSNQLIQKIVGLASQHQAKLLKRPIYMVGRLKYDNKQIYYNLDCIYMATNENMQISFHYYQWNVKKEKVLRHDGKLYQVSPWGVCIDNEKCYLIAYDAEFGDLKTYRIDKMVNMNLVDETRLGKKAFEKQDMASYTKRHFGMFSGKETRVRIAFKEYMTDVLIDRFGSDIFFMKTKDLEYPYEINVSVCVSKKFLSWIMALGNGVKIAGPGDVVEQMQELLRDLSYMYAANTD